MHHLLTILRTRTRNPAAPPFARPLKGAPPPPPPQCTTPSPPPRVRSAATPPVLPHRCCPLPRPPPAAPRALPQCPRRHPPGASALPHSVGSCDSSSSAGMRVTQLRLECLSWTHDAVGGDKW
eukprot:9469236-Pyramimonas_sp.AAC.1